MLESVVLPDRLDLTTVRGQYGRGLGRRRQGAGLPRRAGHPARPRRPRRYAAIRLEIDNRRWSGVPFYLRTGKRLGRRVTEVAVVVQAGAAPAVPADPRPRTSATTPW